ncbi:hypothetical protein GFS60_07078 (plasmid) [Rhodococcus sp. WAY2]|nr:hypothetical protein GFS60_07078 [Rhodococcus sp. WAY2]
MSIGHRPVVSAATGQGPGMGIIGAPGPDTAPKSGIPHRET